MATRKTLPTKLKRKGKTVPILGCELEFIEPSIFQRAKVMDFLVKAMASNLLSPQALSDMTPVEVTEYLKPHLEEFQDLSAKASKSAATAQDQIKLLVLTGSIFSHSELNAFLRDAIEECFPAVKSAADLNDNAIATMFGVMMGEMSSGEDTEAFREMVEDS